MNKKKKQIFGILVIFLISNLIYMKDNFSNPNKSSFNTDTKDTTNTFNAIDNNINKEILMNLEDFPGDLEDFDSTEISEWNTNAIPGAPEIPVRQ